MAILPDPRTLTRPVGSNPYGDAAPPPAGDSNLLLTDGTSQLLLADGTSLLLLSN